LSLVVVKFLADLRTHSKTTDLAYSPQGHRISDRAVTKLCCDIALVFVR